MVLRVQLLRSGMSWQVCRSFGRLRRFQPRERGHNEMARHPHDQCLAKVSGPGRGPCAAGHGRPAQAGESRLETLNLVGERNRRICRSGRRETSLCSLNILTPGSEDSIRDCPDGYQTFLTTPRPTEKQIRPRQNASFEWLKPCAAPHSSGKCTKSN